MRSFSCITAVCALICIIQETHCLLSPCVGAFKATKACLEFVKQKFEDPNEYYFGTAYTTKKKCSYQNATTMGPYVSNRELECVNIRPADRAGTFLTIGSRVWVDNDYKNDKYLNDVVGIVDVQYHSPPEEYHGCNTSAKSILDKTFDVYPGFKPVQAFLLRNSPKIEFPYCTINNLCTVVFYDAGSGVVHNIWTNWPKNQDVSNYRRPGYPGFEPNPYVFLVYSQPGEIQSDLTNDMLVYGDLTKFVTEHNLRGPIGLNVIDVVTDISAQETVTNLGAGNNCAAIVKNVVNSEGPKINMELGVKYPLEFHTWLAVKYDYKGQSVWIDSIQNSFLKQDQLESKPAVLIQPNLIFPTAADFGDKLFTLLFAHPAGLFIDNGGIVPKVFLNWVITNIAEGDISKGNEIQQYSGPVATLLSHQFYFILLLQDKNLEQNDVDKYFDPTCSSTANRNRCQFNLAQFATENRLTFSSLARFRIGDIKQFPSLHNIAVQMPSLHNIAG